MSETGWRRTGTLASDSLSWSATLSPLQHALQRQPGQIPAFHLFASEMELWAHMSSGRREPRAPTQKWGDPSQVWVVRELGSPTGAEQSSWPVLNKRACRLAVPCLRILQELPDQRGEIARQIRRKQRCRCRTQPTECSRRGHLDLILC